jgi:hypothetical protein
MGKVKVVKLYGSVDKVRKRKTRADKGSQRKIYNGKKVKIKRKKSGKFRPYIPPYEKKTNLKVWFWEKCDMSSEGYFRFNKRIRGKMRKTIFKFRHRIDVPINYISTKEKILAFCEEQLWEGTFYVMGFSRGRTTTRVKPVTLCVVHITEHPDGLKARMIENRRLFRYKWYSG